MVPLCLHGGDPLSFFKVDEYSKRVRQEFDKGGLFEGLIQKYLLDNSHHLRLFLTPNEKLGEMQEREDAAKLAELTRALSEAEKEAIVSETKQLKQHQEKLQDQAILPSLGIEDISRGIEFVES